MKKAVDNMMTDFGELREELENARRRCVEVEVERNEFEGRANALNHDLQRALTLIEGYDALIAHLALTIGKHV